MHQFPSILPVLHLQRSTDQRAWHRAGVVLVVTGMFAAMMEQRAYKAMAQQRYLQEVMASKKAQHQDAILVGHNRGVFTIYAKTRVPKVGR